jgi:hypothetical protein
MVYTSLVFILNVTCSTHFTLLHLTVLQTLCPDTNILQIPSTLQIFGVQYSSQPSLLCNSMERGLSRKVHTRSSGQETPHIYETQRNPNIHKNPSFDPIDNQMNLVQILTPYFSMSNVNVASQLAFFFQNFLLKMSYSFLNSPMRLHVSPTDSFSN